MGNMGRSVSIILTRYPMFQHLDEAGLQELAKKLLTINVKTRQGSRSARRSWQ